MGRGVVCEFVDEVPSSAYDSLEHFDGTTLFHTKPWHRVLEKAFSWRIHALLVREAERLKAWLPVVRKRRLGRRVYVSNNNLKGAYTPRYDLGDNPQPGTVVVIDTATNEIEKVIEVEAYATGLGTS